VAIPKYLGNIRSKLSFPDLKAHNPMIILVTPPPVEEHTRNLIDVAEGFKPMHTAGTTAEYAQAAKNVAKELGISCVDFCAG